MSAGLRPAMVLVVAVLVAACGAGATSTAPPSPGATSGSSATSIPTRVPTSPRAEVEPTPAAADTPVRYTVECPDETCVVHRTDADGDETAGWPVVLEGSCDADAAPTEDGGVFIACERDAGWIIHGLGADGMPIEGWPIEPDAPLLWPYWNDFGLIDSAVMPMVSLSRDGAVLALTGTEREADLWVIERDGSPRDGWPRPLPADGFPGFEEAADGTIIAWGFEGLEEGMTAVADRTVFTAFAPNGETRPGWPVGSKGAASGPLVEADGAIVYVSERGNVWRHLADGSRAPGWPYALDWPAPPFIRPDGRLSFVVAGDDTAAVVVLEEDGDPATGWPVDLGGAVETSCIFGETPCVGDVGPTYWPDGAMALALAEPWDDDGGTRAGGGSIIALDRDGAVLDGWPVVLEPRTHALGLEVDADGDLVVAAVVCAEDGWCDPERFTESTIVFDRDGVRLD